jgi:hypothetical protein
LAPWCIDGHNCLLSTANDFLCLSNRCNILNSSRFPQITIEGFFGTGNVDTTFRLGGSIFVGQTNKSSLTFTGIVKPWSFISLKLEVDEPGGSILGNGDGVLRITISREKEEKWISALLDKIDAHNSWYLHHPI